MSERPRSWLPILGGAAVKLNIVFLLFAVVLFAWCGVQLSDRLGLSVYYEFCLIGYGLGIVMFALQPARMVIKRLEKLETELTSLREHLTGGA
jgi:hypothetical protein